MARVGGKNETRGGSKFIREFFNRVILGQDLGQRFLSQGIEELSR